MNIKDAYGCYYLKEVKICQQLTSLGWATDFINTKGSEAIFWMLDFGRCFDNNQHHQQCRDGKSWTFCKALSEDNFKGLGTFQS